MASWKRVSKEAEAAWHAFLRGGSPQTAPSWLRPFALTGLSVALTAVLFAIGDLTSPRDLGRLLIAVAWLLAGVNGLFAAYALVSLQRWWVGPTVAAGLSSIVIAGYILWADSRSPEPEPWILVIWFLMFAGIATVAATAWQHRITPVVTWKVVLTSVLPFFVVVQFWYTTQYVRLHHDPQVNLLTSLQEIGRSQTTIALKGTVTIENNSEGRVQVMGSIYRVTGETRGLSTADTSPPPDEHQLAASIDWGTPNLNRFDAPPTGAPPRLLQADEVIGQDFYFDPGEKWSTDVAIFADTGAYDRVRLEAELYVGRSANLDLGDPRPCYPREKIPITSDDDAFKFVCSERTVRPINTVESRVGDSPLVETQVTVSGPSSAGPYPALGLFLGNKSALRSDDQGELEHAELQLLDRYPVTSTNRSTELPVR